MHIRPDAAHETGGITSHALTRTRRDRARCGQDIAPPQVVNAPQSRRVTQRRRI